MTVTRENFTFPDFAAIFMLIEYSAPEDFDLTTASFTFSVFFTPLHFPFDLLVSTFFPL